MNEPVIAIVGRPNVGKSSLFNRVVGRRIAVVDDLPGVTRDRLYAPVSHNDRAFRIADTGGLIPNPDDPVIEQVRSQVDVAVREASLVWFLVDAIDGLTAADRAVADMLRETEKPIIVVANKADNQNIELNVPELYELGFETLVSVSAIHRRGIFELLDLTVGRLPEASDDDEPYVEEERPLRIAVVGRPNAGKSSIVNAMLGENRVIVDEVPGTTRDAINVQFEWQGADFELVDTAGMRRKARIEQGGVEQHSVLRATRSVEQSDVTWLVLDVTREIAHQDKTIMGFVARHGKLCILVANKWDLIEKDNDTFNEYAAWIHEQFRAFDYLPIVFTSAVTKQRVESLLELSQQLYTTGSARVPTPALNEWLRTATMERRPRVVSNRRPALKYITQTGVLPPTFVVFCTYPHLVDDFYGRYLTRRLREEFQFDGVPIRFEFRDSRPDSAKR